MQTRPHARSLVAAAALAAAGAAACTRSHGEAPRPTSVTPDRGPATAPVRVRIAGERFGAAVSTDFSQPEESGVDARFEVRLGAVALGSVTLQPDGSLTAIVPEGLPTGPYDLEVVDPAGRAGTLPRAYRVLAADDAGAAVAAFRVEAAPTQEALRPFAITITAVDAAGATVSAFNGAVHLSDTTGTLVPPLAGLFAGGRWSGEVEVRAPHPADVITASDDQGHAGSAPPIAVEPAPAVSLAFATAPRSATAGACEGPVVLALTDAFGTPTRSAEATRVALAADAGAALELFADEGCAVAGNAFSIEAGAGGVSAWYRTRRAGALDLTASAASLVPATQRHVVAPAAPAGVAFVTTPRTVNAGACSPVATVELRDAYGNPSPPAAGATLTLAAEPAGGLAFHADPGCSSAISALAVAPGAARADFFFRGTQAQAVTASVGGAGLAPAAQAELVTAEGAASSLVVLSPPRATVAGRCSEEVTLQAQDSFGNAVASAGAVLVTLAAPAPGVAFYSDPGCTTESPAIVIGAGQSTAGFHYRGTAVGTVTVTASSTTLTAAQQDEAVLPAPAAALVFASAPQVVAAGACSGAVAIDLVDPFQNAAPAGAPVAVTLSADPPDGVAFHAEPLCTSPVSSATIAAGASATRVYFRATRAGDVSVAAAAGPLSGASQTERILPGPAQRLAFVTPPQTLAAGDCSGAVTLRSEDGHGNAAPLETGATIALGASPAGVASFFADATCSTEIASIDVPPGASGASFFFRATTPGALTAAADAPGLAGASQQQTVRAGVPARLVLSGDPQEIEAGACSAAVTVEATDALGNPSPAPAPIAVQLSAAPTGLAFHAGPGCAGAALDAILIPAGAAAATFSFRGEAAGATTISAASDPLAPASQPALVRAAPPDRVVFASAPQARRAGACSAPVELVPQDAYGNVSPAAITAALTLSAAPPGGFAFFADAACTIPLAAPALAAGASGATFHFRGTSPGAVTLTALGAGLAGSASQVETISAAPPDHLAFATATQTVEAGACSAPAEVRSEDAYANPSPVEAATDVALLAAPEGATFHAGAGCAGAPVASVAIPAGAATATFSFRATAAGALSVTASAAGMSPSPTQVETVTPAPAARLSFATAPQSVTSGECSARVALEARDAYGNPAPLAAGVDVTLAAAPASGVAFFLDASCTAAVTSVAIPAGGSGAGFHFAGTTGGSPALVAVTADAPGLLPATQDETISPAAAPTRLVFATPPPALVAGRCSDAAIVEAQDTAGVPRSPYADATVSFEAAPAGLAFFADPACIVPLGAGATLSPGATRVSVWMKAFAAGTVTVTASSPPLTSAAQAAAVTAAPATRLAFTTPPQTRVAGACSAAIGLRSEDAFGNPSPVSSDAGVAVVAAPGTGFTLHADAACATPLAGGLTLAAGAAAVSFHFRGTVPGDVTVTASAAVLGSAAQDETVVAAPPERLAFASAAQSVVAGACSGAVVVRSEDAFGNPSPIATGTTIGVAAAPSAGVTFHEGAGCAGGAVTSIALAAGASSATFSFRATAAGSLAVTVSAAGMTPSPTQLEAVAPAPADHLVFVTAPQARTAGSCSAPVTVEARDVHGNPSPAAAPLTVAVSAAPAAGVALYSDAACTAPLAGGAAMAAGASRATYHFRGTAAGAVTVTASAPGMAPDPSQVETVSPAAPDHLALEGDPLFVEAGACSPPVTVRTVDAFGNPSPSGTAVTVALAAPPAAALSFHAGAGCAGAPAGAITVPAGASAAVYSFRATAAGSATVTASAAGMAPDASRAETIVPAPPDRLVFRSAPQTTEAGACSGAVAVESLDAFGNASPVPAPVDAVLSAAPAPGVTFHADPGCTVPLAAAPLAAGSSGATFHYRATQAGSVVLGAAVAGFAEAAGQVATVTPGAPDRIAWDPIPSPQAQGTPFAVTLRARDAFGNATPAFTGTAALSAAVGTVSCASSCSGASATGGFAAGVWTGSIAVMASGTAVSVVATAGGLAGTSNAFDVTGAAGRSPPLARFSASQAVVLAGEAVTFDASRSSDYQTPTAQLEVSWDFQATAASFSAAAAPPAAPWTAWSTAKTASNVYPAAGIYQPRLAVRDLEAGPGGPDVGYATATVVVLSSAASLCTVTTAADVDDGADSCASGAAGPDGKLSLREAVRLANAMAGTPTIAFSGPMTISGTGSLALTRGVQLVAQAGVILDTLSLTLASPGILVSGLELARLATPITVTAAANVTLRDLHVHDGAGIVVLGAAFLSRVRMAGCSGTCVHVNDSKNAQLAVFYSEFRGGGGNDAIRLDACRGGTTGVYEFSPLVFATTFGGFATGIRSACSTTVVNGTFVGNGTGVYGSGAYMLNTIFSEQTVQAVGSTNCAAAFAGYRRQQLLWQNASNGCLAADLADPVGTGAISADPMYVFPSARDYRIQHGSPAKDSGDDPYEIGVYAMDLNDAGPAIFFGAAADRGGRETY